MHALPVELLEHIFLAVSLCAAGYGDWVKGLPPQVVLTHVCRRWRSITRRQPALWTRIPLDNITFAHLFLRRAQAHAVELVTLSDTDVYLSQNRTCTRYLRSLVRLISKPTIATQMKHVHWKWKFGCTNLNDSACVCHDFMAAAMEQLPDGMHSLRSLTITGSHSELPLRDSSISSCRFIRRLELVDCGMPSPRALQQLASLDTLILIGTSSMSSLVLAQDLLDALRALPQIQCLIFTMDLIVTSALNPVPVTLPNLHRISLGSTDRGQFRRREDDMSLLSHIAGPMDAQIDIACAAHGPSRDILRCLYNRDSPRTLSLALNTDDITMISRPSLEHTKFMSDTSSNQRCTLLSEPSDLRIVKLSVNDYVIKYTLGDGLFSHLRSSIRAVREISSLAVTSRFEKSGCNWETLHSLFGSWSPEWPFPERVLIEGSAILIFASALRSSDAIPILDNMKELEIRGIRYECKGTFTPDYLVGALRAYVTRCGRPFCHLVVEEDDLVRVPTLLALEDLAPASGFIVKRHREVKDDEGWQRPSIAREDR